MGTGRKRLRTYPVNLLRQYHERQTHDNDNDIPSCYLVDRYSDDETDDDDADSENWAPSIPPLCTTQTQTYLDAEIPKDLTPTKQGDLKSVLKTFDKALSDVPGCTNLVEHHLRRTTDTHIRRKPYRLPYSKEGEVKAEIQKMLDLRIIEESNSPYASPIVCVPKPSGELRITIDYRLLNKTTVFDPYPMPRIQDIIDKVGPARYITTLDLTQGYYQIGLAPESRPLSAFVTPFGQYEFKVLPFEMSGSEATFQRLVDKVLLGYEDFARAYIDDIAIFSPDWETHMKHVSLVLERLQKAGLTAKRSKCKFARRSVTYLGHVIGNGTVKPSPTKIEAMQNFPRPITKKDVRSLLGLANYYRSFIPDFATIALPLTDSTRKNQPNKVKWDNDKEQAFLTLKQKLTSEPVLLSPDMSKEFIIQSDASDRAIGAVLTQLDDNGNEHPVAYLSKELDSAQEKYSIMEKECLAIIHAIKQWHVYLYGNKFQVQTDHKSLQWLERMKHTNNRLTRWSLALQPYHMTTSYRKGSANANADALSRI